MEIASKCGFVYFEVIGFVADRFEWKEAAFTKPIMPKSSLSFGKRMYVLLLELTLSFQSIVLVVSDN